VNRMGKIVRSFLEGRGRDQSTDACDRTRAAFAGATPGPQDQGHLFACPDCRTQVRLAQAWKSVPRPESVERPLPADEAFVSRVLREVRAERRRSARARTTLAAAAALLFFFLAGAAGQLAATSASGAEDDYAQLVSPTGLDSLLPQ
jgi:hypothetical protein